MALSAVVVVLAVSAVAQIGPASGPYRRTVDRGYAALAGPLAAQSDTLGAALVSFLRDAPSLGRVTFFSALDSLAADTTTVLRRYKALTPPNPVTATGCVTAMAGRASAVGSLRTSLESVLGGRTGLEPVDANATAMEAAGAALGSADASWASCRRALRRAPGSAVLARSVWVHDPGMFEAAASDRFVAKLASSRSLAAVHNLAIVAVVTDPSAVASGQTLVVPATTGVVTHVVVANRGNVDEEGVEVGGVVTVQGAPPSPVLVQRKVDLAAGRSMTMALRRFAVAPGSSYTVQVDAASPKSSGLLASRSVSIQVQSAATLTSVTSSPLTVVRGRPVTLTAGLTSALSGPGAGSPTGTVAFDDDGATIPGCGAQPLHAGQATCTTTYPTASTHAITAAYSGDSGFSGSLSPAITLKVG